MLLVQKGSQELSLPTVLHQGYLNMKEIDMCHLHPLLLTDGECIV